MTGEIVTFKILRIKNMYAYFKEGAMFVKQLLAALAWQHVANNV